ncbi:MAG TPA: ribbon-helix-helix protein, CopG family [Planctomycetaceae bacterium]|nr:ribbon-helix-helix protein, CopG family [Planctomycetaceae bacterium]
MSLTIQLDPATAEAVQELAAEQQRSADEVVRDALSAYVRSAKRGLPKGIGKYHSGRSDVSTQARQILRDAARDGQWP